MRYSADFYVERSPFVTLMVQFFLEESLFVGKTYFFRKDSRKSAYRFFLNLLYKYLYTKGWHISKE
ncbi:MAG: hypothetical protein JWP88_953 [Flaviaesturariibacter sp.]|nr:hypothetical protein [Flaviaesturariibacter sp.]